MNVESALRVAACAVLSCLFAACAAGPKYERPVMTLPASFKDGGVEWHRVQPERAPAPGGEWWRDFDDSVLDDLVAQARGANQNLAQAEAAYRQAQAGVRAARAQFVPTLGVGVDATRGTDTLSRQLQQAQGKPSSGSGSAPIAQTITVEANAAWEPDFWGKVRRNVEAQHAAAQAAAADLAGEQLSIASSVVGDYLNLRQLDIDIASLDRQRALYARLLAIAEQTRAHGAASDDDVLNARNNLDNASAGSINARTSREQYEHAIAVLCGRTPAGFGIPVRTDYRFVAPAATATEPSELLRRRPDIAAAERRVAAANAQIGMAEAAYFPSLGFSADSGFSNDALSGLFSVPNRIWSVGPQLAQTIFDGGARRAQVAQARAGLDAAAAVYRQTVLAAFGEVEDDLSAVRQLGELQRYQNDILARQRTLLAHLRQQREAGVASEQNLLTDELSLAIAERNASDAAAQNGLAAVKLIAAIGGAGGPVPPRADALLHP